MPTRRAYLRRGALCGVVGVTGCLDDPRGSDDPPADDWPMYRRDVRNTGATHAEGPTGDVEVRWSVERDVSSSLSWPPAVLDDTVYVGDTRVSALDASTGEERWSVPTGDDETGNAASPLTVTDGTVYLGSHRRYVTALSTTDGEERWRHDVGGEVYAGPTVADGRPYVGTDGGEVYALADGEARWSVQVAERPTGQVSGAPAVADGVVYVTTNNLHRDEYQPGTYALDAETGEQLWFAPTESPAGTFASPVVVDGSVYLVDVDGTVQALDAETGTERWRVHRDGLVEYSVAVADGAVFVPSEPLAAYDAETGDELWTTDETGLGIAPVVAGDTLHVTGYDDTVHAMAADTGERRWRFDLGDAPPATGSVRPRSSPGTPSTSRVRAGPSTRSRARDSTPATGLRYLPHAFSRASSSSSDVSRSGAAIRNAELSAAGSGRSATAAVIPVVSTTSPSRYVYSSIFPGSSAAPSSSSPS